MIRSFIDRRGGRLFSYRLGKVSETMYSLEAFLARRTLNARFWAYGKAHSNGQWTYTAFRMLVQNRSISDDFLDIARFPPQSVDLLRVYLTSGDVLGLIGFGPPSSSDQPSRSPKLFPKTQNLLFLSRTTSKHALLTAGNVSGRFTRSPKADIQNLPDYHREKVDIKDISAHLRKSNHM